jgi:hypothetical protein
MHAQHEEMHHEFENDMRTIVDKYITYFGGYGSEEDTTRFYSDGHYRRITKTFKNVSEEAIMRFKKEGKRRKSWPFNDSSLILNNKLEPIFHELCYQKFQRTDKERNIQITRYGGKGFSRQKYNDEDKFGNIVVEPNYEIITLNTGIGERSIKNYVLKMERAGIISRITRNSRKKLWYIIGDWQNSPNGFKENYRLSRLSLRSQNKCGLIDQGLAKLAKNASK